MVLNSSPTYRKRTKMQAHKFIFFCQTAHLFAS